MIIDQLRSEKDGQVLKIFLSEPLTISYSQPEEKDFTDLFCAVKKGIELNANNFKIFGALGERLDHSYANLCVAKYLSENNIEHELITDDFKIFVIKQGNNKVIENMKGSLVSIFSFGVDLLLVIVIVIVEVVFLTVYFKLGRVHNQRHYRFCQG